jgi:hypothetical protein
LLADGIPRDHQDAALDPVADERRLLGIEQVLLVGPQLEECEGVGAVLTDELGCRAPQLRLRKVSRRSQRAEHHVRGGKQREQACDPHGGTRSRELVVECERSALPEEQVARCADDVGDRRRWGSRKRNGSERHEEDAGQQERQSPHRRPQRRRRVTDIERRTARPQQCRSGRRQRGLLDVEPLDKVEDRERGHETECEPKCS